MSKFNLFQENRGQAEAAGIAWAKAPGQRGLWRIACNACGREDRKRWAADMPAEIIIKKLRGVGWSVDVKSPPLCPSCARAPRNANGKETPPMTAIPEREDPRTERLRLRRPGPAKAGPRRQAPKAGNGVYPSDAEQPLADQTGFGLAETAMVWSRPEQTIPDQPAPTSGRRPRQYKRVGFAVIDETMAQLGLETRTELARMLGVADNTVSGWAKKGEVPAWVELACHGLVSLGKPAPAPQEPDDIVIVRLRADKKDALVSMLDAMDVDYRQI